MNKNLFNYLVQARIFKNNSRYGFGGVGRILASEKTEEKRAEKRRLAGRPYTKKEWQNVEKHFTEKRRTKLSGQTIPRKQEVTQ